MQCGDTHGGGTRKEVIPQWQRHRVAGPGVRALRSVGVHSAHGPHSGMHFLQAVLCFIKQALLTPAPEPATVSNHSVSFQNFSTLVRYLCVFIFLFKHKSYHGHVLHVVSFPFFPLNTSQVLKTHSGHGVLLQ